MVFRELIFLHGGPGFPDYLSEFFQDGFPQNFKLTFYEQSRGPDVSLETLVEQLHQIVRSKSKPVYLVGHSWGGTLALEYVKRYATQINGLVLIDGCISSEHFADQFNAELKHRGIAADDTDSIFFTEAEKPSGRNLLAALFPKFDAALFDHFEKSYLSSFDLTSLIASLQIPILNLFGSEDVRIPARVLVKINELNPRVRQVVIEDAGHFPFLLPHHRRRSVEAIQQFVETASDRD